jgi:hypothetical protein
MRLSPSGFTSKRSMFSVKYLLLLCSILYVCIHNGGSSLSGGRGLVKLPLDFKVRFIIKLSNTFSNAYNSILFKSILSHV